MKTSNKLFCAITATIFIITLVAALAFRAGNPDLTSESINQLSKHMLAKEGHTITKPIAVSPFQAISTNGKFVVTLHHKSPQSVSLSAGELVLPTIRINTEDGVLQASSMETPAGLAKLDINFEHLQQLTLTGKNLIHADDIQTDHLILNVNGSSMGYVKGTCKSVIVNLNGKTQLDLNFGAADSIQLNVNGKGMLRLVGSVNHLTLVSHGKTEVDAKELVANNVTIQSAGASTITVQALQSLSVQALGKSDIHYSGNPSITKNIFGESTLTKMDTVKTK